MLIDQTLLPERYEVIALGRVASVCEAIYMLRVRGAPALGVAGAYGVLVAVEEEWGGDGYFFDSDVERDDAAETRFDSFQRNASVEALRRRLSEMSEKIASTRPTAVNLGWAVARMRRVFESPWSNCSSMLTALQREADSILEEDIAMCRQLGEHGSTLLDDHVGVITHCNTGGLATGGFGTALGVVFAAAASGKAIHVFADETRPLLQGARLTAWECIQRDIPVTVLVDGAAASLLASGQVHCAIVGADRIAANGDTANKIGTLGLALLAKHHEIPFYVAAPTSTIDSGLATGDQIPIEQRPAMEVLQMGGRDIAPSGANAYNPAFDVTSHDLISAIVTETGVHRPPYQF